ncbi:hypothetical protein GCM10028786_30600 [Flaviaesturariibacter terrae]
MILAPVAGLLAQTGTVDGTYNFASLGVADGGASGYKAQQDKFLVSNIFVQVSTNRMYANNTTAGASQFVVLKANNSVIKTFTLKDMKFQNGGPTNYALSVFNITLKDYSGNTIAAHSLASNVSLNTSGTTSVAMSAFPFSTAWPAAGYDNVNSVEITFQYSAANVHPDNMDWVNWTLANLSNTTPTSLTVGSISGSPFCAGSSISIPYTATGINSGNTFTAQLSDASGSFASPTTLGTVSSTASGTISGTIPTNTGTGTGYRVRVVASNPGSTSSDNGSNLAINAKPSASISSFTNVACFNGSNGTITVTASGGTPSYSYSWSPSGGTAATAINLSSGNYTVTVQDSKGCQATATRTLTQPASALSGSVVISNVACFGGTTGAVNLTASGGTPGYTYNWGGGVTSEDRTNLSSGTYGVTITDANSCQYTIFPISVTQPSAPVSGTTVVSTVACFGRNTGAINLTPSGGAGGYTFLWNNGTTTTEDRAGLVAGTYSVTITDANSCTGTVGNIVVSQPSAAVSGTTVVTSVACFGGNTGAINLTPAGGAGGYTFLWNNGTTTTEDRTGLTAGNYSVTITDANSCTSTVSNILVTQPTSPVSGSTVVTSVACFGGTTGAINLTPTGGAGGYTFLWNNGSSSTEDRTNLTAGTYSVTITDANGCQGTVSNIIVGQPSAAISGTTVVTNAACFGGNTGAINLTPSGGVGGYTFLWNNASSTTEDRTGLTAGTYAVTITDANGCIGTVNNILVSQPSAAVSGSTVVTNVACFGGANGAINLTPSGGTAGYTFNWGNSITTEDRVGLASGNYSVTITDANGCTGTLSNIQVTQPSAPVSGTASVSNVSCFGGSNGSINLTPGGGTTGYTYNWGGSITTEDRTGLTAGSYSVTITDANGCTGTVSNIQVTQPAQLAVDAVGNQTVCAGHNSSAVSFSGNAGSYEWTNDNNSIGLAGSGSGNIDAFAAANATTAPVSATISVTPVSGGCSGAPISFTITVNPAPSATITYAGSPYATGSGSASASFSGTTSGSYSSTSGLALDATTGAIDLSASLPGTYTVTYTVAAAGSCDSYSTTTSVTLYNPFSASISYSGSPYCDATGTATVTHSGSSGGTYTATPAGLSIDAGSGAIDLAASAAGTYTVRYGISPSQFSNTQVVIRPAVLINGLPNTVLCNGDSYGPVTLTGAPGLTLSWTAQNTAIGIAASGQGSIPAFTGSNSGNSLISSYIYLQARGGTGCPTGKAIFRLSVNPTPVLSGPGSAQLCAGSASGPITFASTVAGTSVSWTNTNTSIGLNGSGSGSIPSFSTVNNSGILQTATITATGQAEGCAASPYSLQLDVSPAAGTITYSGSPYCQAGWAYVRRAGSLGGTFSSAPAGLALNPSDGSVNLAASTPGTYTVTYTVGASGGCSPTATTSITIKPMATVNGIANQVYCNGTVTAPIAFSGTATNFSWTNDNTSVGLAASGTGTSLPSFTTVNAGPGVQYAYIKVTPLAGSNSCVGKAIGFRISVNFCPPITQSGGTAAGGDGTARLSPAASVQLSPNPASTQLTVRYSGSDAGPFSVQLLDAQGAPATRLQSFTGASTTIDLSTVRPGIYLLQLVNARTAAALQKQVIKL